MHLAARAARCFSVSGQSHTAVLFVLVMLILGVAVLLRAGELSAYRPIGDAWICASNADSLRCFLASFLR